METESPIPRYNELTESDLRAMCAHCRLSVGETTVKIIQTLQLQGAKSIDGVINNPSSAARATAIFWSELYRNYCSGLEMLSGDFASITACLIETAKQTQPHPETPPE